MAGHSAQGPKLGIPQMIQSRAQFGYLGASVPLVVVMLMYVGFRPFRVTISVRIAIISAIFDPDGQYGGVDWRSMLAFGFGIGVELPFVSSSFYTGPLVRDVGGADISWILGIFASGGAYYLLMRRYPVRRGVRAQSVTGDLAPAPGDVATELGSIPGPRSQPEKPSTKRADNV
jgi:purine-cytosine permease-like protein